MTTKRPAKIQCDKCEGVGSIPDPVAMGAWFRAERMNGNVKQNELARQLNISPTYLHDMEMGRRRWTLDLERKALIALRLEITPR